MNEIELTDEEIKFLELYRSATDKERKEVQEFLEEERRKDIWNGKVH